MPTITIDDKILPYAIPPLLSSFVVLALGTYVLLKNHRSQTNVLFSLLMYACTVWQSGFAFMNVMKHDEDAFIFSRVLYIWVTKKTTFFFFFFFYFFKYKTKPL